VIDSDPRSTDDPGPRSAAVTFMTTEHFGTAVPRFLDPTRIGYRLPPILSTDRGARRGGGPTNGE